MKIDWSVPAWMVSDDELCERLHYLESLPVEVKYTLPEKKVPFNMNRFGGQDET